MVWTVLIDFLLWACPQGEKIIDPSHSWEQTASMVQSQKISMGNTFPFSQWLLRNCSFYPSYTAISAFFSVLSSEHKWAFLLFTSHILQNSPGIFFSRTPNRLLWDSLMISLQKSMPLTLLLGCTVCFLEHRQIAYFPQVFCFRFYCAYKTVQQSAGLYHCAGLFFSSPLCLESWKRSCGTC